MNDTQPFGTIKPTGGDQFSPYQPLGHAGTDPAGRHYKAPKNPRRILAVLVGAALLLLGIGIGSTKPAPPAEVRTETKTVTQEVTPPDCLKALDLAGNAISMLSESPKLASEGIYAAYDRDAAAISAVTVKVKDLNARIDAAAPALGTAARSCRNSAK